ncbi:hypothetical protein [Photobacterium kagoshimensis]|uniref:hypothetical protein n=1 Tax=Photobacterium kagoshimensis TaxID=2910242 RepID=UPI003D0A374F
MTPTLFRHSSPQIAKVALVLVMVVITLCLSQRSGWVSSCPNAAQYSEQHPAHSPAQKTTLHEFIQEAATKIPDASNLTEPSPITQKSCDMSDHLLQIHGQSLELGLLYLPFIFILLSLLSTGHSLVPALTEPIPSTQRRHLTFCVFRE